MLFGIHNKRDVTIARVSERNRWNSSFSFGSQLSEEVGLAFANVVFTLLKSLLSLVPSLLGDLLLSFLLEDGISADGSVSFLVEGFNLVKETKIFD
jgi:hypothetical protein